MQARTINLAVVWVLAIGPGALYAQEPRAAIAVDLFLPAVSPVSRLSGEDMTFVPLNVMYQRVLTAHQVLMLKLGFTYNWSDDGETSRDVNPMLALHWHPYDTGLKGFYIGPSLFFDRTTNSYSGTPEPGDLDHSELFAVGGNIGYEFVPRPNWIVNLIFGLGYGYSKEVDVSGNVTSEHRVDETIGGVFVGYSF